MDIHHKTIQTNGIKLHVAQAGEGMPVLLLHGFPEFWYGWHPLIEPLTEAGYQLWMPDQRGYNLSDKPDTIQAYSLDEITKDILGLADAMGREKILLVGHDWGGAAAWWFANKYPERVEKLVILNVGHHSAIGKALRTMWKQRLRSSYILFFQLPYLPEWVCRFGNWWFLARVLRRSSRPNTFSNADLQKYREAWSQPGAFTAMLNWYRALARAKRERLPSTRITVPTLIIWGKRDGAFEPAVARLSLEKCDNGRLKMFDTATHWIHHEEPAQVSQLMIDFWQS